LAVMERVVWWPMLLPRIHWTSERLVVVVTAAAAVVVVVVWVVRVVAMVSGLGGGCWIGRREGGSGFLMGS
jgi:hypothetical protein